MSQKPGAPQPLNASHLLDEFACGEAGLDDWLKRHALGKQPTGTSRTFVVSNSAGQVLGYYTMSAGAVSHPRATSNAKGKIPAPAPVMVLARLAVDQRAQATQLGGALLQDAVKRCLVIVQNTGVRVLLAHTLHERARQFYEHYGFRMSPQHPPMLMLRLPLVPG